MLANLLLNHQEIHCVEETLLAKIMLGLIFAIDDLSPNHQIARRKGKPREWKRLDKFLGRGDL